MKVFSFALILLFTLALNGCGGGTSSSSSNGSLSVATQALSYSGIWHGAYAGSGVGIQQFYLNTSANSDNTLTGHFVSIPISGVVTGEFNNSVSLTNPYVLRLTVNSAGHVFTMNAYKASDGTLQIGSIYDNGTYYGTGQAFPTATAGTDPATHGWTGSLNISGPALSVQTTIYNLTTDSGAIGGYTPSSTITTYMGVIISSNSSLYGTSLTMLQDISSGAYSSLSITGTASNGTEYNIATVSPATSGANPLTSIQGSLDGTVGGQNVTGATLNLLGP